jgi:ADP-ribosylglycohydrolase
VILHETTRIGFVEDSLTGLSVGDALGAQYFVAGNRVADLLAETLPAPVWEWTDDTKWHMVMLHRGDRQDEVLVLPTNLVAG